ncbi:hypothetical protein AWQ21_06450 [Picosynechococcus sp. PCC 7003]|uniref:hypothetical protein n=1 Tax=Picosynechococcus sp. PCC 7003 TaxID=374981 RepID=UPI0008106161|nr:hypothetical protein [Picosynechococcus sp. PCC 7003]ANV84051.1 hypothetical protein AWQ21_06450 [Picosynechococcus sp. PCC 7003]
MNIKSLLTTITCLSIGCLAPKAALAHAIETNFQVRFDNFEIQSTFGDGEVFPNAPVTVYSPDNPDQPIMIGRTDENGKFSFKADTTKAGDWAVEIGSADDSHWDRLIVPVQAEGIDANAISEVPQPEHSHDYFAYSFLAGIVGLGLVFGLRQGQDQA